MDSVNVSIVRQAYEDYRHGNLGKIKAALADDVSWRVVGEQNSFAPFGEWRTPDGALDYFDRLAKMLDTERLELEEFVAEGDTVIVTGRTFGVIKASRKKVEVEWIHVFKLKDGKITSYREFLDTARLLAAARVPEAVQ